MLKYRVPGNSGGSGGGGVVISNLQRQFIDIATSGGNMIVPGVANQKVTVYSLIMYGQAATDVTMKSWTGSGFGTELSGPLMSVTGMSFKELIDGNPLWQTATGEGFAIFLDAATQWGGTLYYTQR